MKKRINKLAVMTLVIGISVGLTGCFDLVSIKGNGILVTSEKKVAAFDKISSFGGAEVHVYASDEHRVVVTVDENLSEHIDVFVEGGTLKVGTKKGYNCSFTRFTVEVYCPSVKGITVTGSGSVEGKIECDTFRAIITGSGKIKVSGNAANADITITGSGNFNGEAFQIKNATATTTGSGSMNLNVSDHLKAKTTGSGSIKYRGNPRTDTRSTGSGKIEKITLNL